MVLRRFVDPWQEFGQLRREVAAAFEAQRRGEFLGGAIPFNSYANDDTLVLTAELPGLDSNSLELEVEGSSLTVRGKRGSNTPEGVRHHLRERPMHEFTAKIELPWAASPEQTEAVYEKGVLTLTLHRPEADKPRKISVRTA